MAIILRGEEGAGGDEGLDGSLVDIATAGFDVPRCRSLLVSPCARVCVCVCVCVCVWVCAYYDIVLSVCMQVNACIVYVHVCTLCVSMHMHNIIILYTTYVHVGLHLTNKNNIHIYIFFMRNEKEDERKKEASKIKQTTRQSNTAHPRKSLFLSKISWDSNPRHSTCTCPSFSHLSLKHVYTCTFNSLFSFVRVSTLSCNARIF